MKNCNNNNGSWYNQRASHTLILSKERVWSVQGVEDLQDEGAGPSGHVNMDVMGAEVRNNHVGVAWVQEQEEGGWGGN